MRVREQDRWREGRRWRGEQRGGKGGMMEGRKRKGMGGKHRVGKGKRTEKITFYWLTHFLFWSALSFFSGLFPP